MEKSAAVLLTLKGQDRRCRNPVHPWTWPCHMLGPGPVLCNPLWRDTRPRHLSSSDQFWVNLSAGPVFTCSQPAAPCLIVCQSAPLFLRPLVCCYLPHSSYILHCLSAFIISFSCCSNIQNKPSTWCLKISLNKSIHTGKGDKKLQNGVDH